MRPRLDISVWLAVALASAGCGTACGPMRTVPPQRLAILAPSPERYTVRVQPKTGLPTDTPVPPHGRLVFEVPVRSRDSTIFCFGLPVYHYPPPETLRVIHVMCESRTLRKLSAREIGQLPKDAEGYPVLRIEPGD